MDDEEDDEDEDDEDEEEDEEEEEEEEDELSGNAGQGKKRKRDTGRGGQNGVSGNAGMKAEDGGAKKKAKPTRGAKACKNCRRLKMRCVGAENGPPCDRCKNTNHECIFEESNRGKKSGKYQRTEAMAASLRKMEATMNSLIQSLRDPSRAFSSAAGIVTRTPTPESGAAGRPGFLTAQSDDRERLRRGWRANDEADELGRVYNIDGSTQSVRPIGPTSESVAQGMLVGQSLRNMTGSDPNHVNPSTMSTSHVGQTSAKGARFIEPELPHRKQRAASPRLHSLPDNNLNPLGLLAEASLHNHQRSRRLSRNRGQGEDPVRNALRAATEASSAASTAGNNSSPASAATSGTKAAAESPAVDGIKTEAEEGSTPSKRCEDSAAATAASVASGGRPEVARSESGVREQPAAKVGVASETYFKPGPMTILPLRKIVIERELAPELLTSGIVTSEEVLELFRIFFHHCSQHVVLFDADWHTPTMICGRSPFLFTVVCTIASKFYSKRPDLHMQCLEVVRKCAYVIMSRGFKSVEIVQGFLLLSMWQTPAQRFEEDKTWMFSGVAIRMATDLNLHRKSMASIPGQYDANDPAVLEREREIINRERTWLLCFCVDRSISGQMGKPWTIREDWIIRNSRHWGLQRLSKPYDLGLSALVELLRITTRQFDFLFSSTTTVSGLNTDIDYSTTLRIFNEQLHEWHDIWQARGFFTTPHSHNKEIDPSLRPTSEERELAERLRSADVSQAPADDEDHDRRTMHFITKQAPLRFNYAVLLLNSFGLQHSIDFPKRSGMDKGLYLSKCIQAAKEIVFAARDGMRPVLCYAPDTHFIIISYACVFLLKLTRPTFASYVDEDEVVAIVTECADLLDEVAMDPSHMPALYAQFLRALLQSRQERSTRSGATTPYKSGAASPIDSTGGAEHQAEPGSASGFSGPEMFGHQNGTGSAPGSAPGTRAGVTADQAAMLSGDNSVNAGLHGEHIDQLLNESFWSTLLPPGFGGPLDGLANGTVEMYPTMPESGHTPHHGFSGISPSPRVQLGGPSTQQTRANTPVMVSTFGPGVSMEGGEMKAVEDD